MSTRYVWDKYNASENVSYSKKVVDSNWSRRLSSGWRMTVYSSVSIANGKFSFSGQSTKSDPDNLRGYWYNGITTATYIDDMSSHSGGDYFYIYGTEYGIDKKVSYSVGALIGQISANEQNAYPADGYAAPHWYKYKGSDTIDPESVTIPASANGSEPLPVTVTPRAPVHGGTIAYKYEYSVDGGGSWVSAGDATTATTKRIAIPAGTQTMRVRVRAQDNLGFVSADYVAASQTATVEWNQPPVISGEDRDLGTLGMDKPAPYAYIVTDADGDAVTVTEAIDGVPFKTHQPPLGVQQTCTVPDETWLGVLNGRHTLTIAATDGKISGGG